MAGDAESTRFFSWFLSETKEHALLTLDLKGLISSWDENASKLLGYTQEEACGLPLSRIYVGQTTQPPTTSAELLRAQTEGRSECEGNCRRKNGSLVWCRLILGAFRDQNGGLQGFGCLIKDESEKRKLRESEERYRFLIDNIPQIVWTATPDGVQDFANQRWYEFNGIDRNKKDPEPWRGVIHPEDVQKTAECWHESLTTGKPYSCLHRNRRYDGEFRWVLSRAVPQRDSQGKIVCWIGSGTDITRLRRAEEELQQALALRDEFLSIASHELKTPLTSLSLQLQLLERLIKASGSDLTGRWSAMFVKTSKQMARLGRLIEDLLDVSRIQTGKLTFLPEAVNLSELVRDVLDRMQVQLDDAGCTLTLRLVPECVGQWDRMRIEQIVINLLSNVVKYAPRSVVTVETAKWENEAILVVQDTGPGIDPKNHAVVFNRFERAGMGTGISGLGLGLFIVRSIAEGHEGAVALDSSPGKGSKFTIRLPLSPVRFQNLHERHAG